MNIDKARSMPEEELQRAFTDRLKRWYIPTVANRMNVSEAQVAKWLEGQIPERQIMVQFLTWVDK